MKGSFQSSSQAAICYCQSIDSKVEAIPLSALPKYTTSELAGLSSHYPFNAERQAGKQWIVYQLYKFLIFPLGLFSYFCKDK